MPDCILANGHTLVVTCEGNNRIGMERTSTLRIFRGSRDGMWWKRHRAGRETRDGAGIEPATPTYKGYRNRQGPSWESDGFIVPLEGLGQHNPGPREGTLLCSCFRRVEDQGIAIALSTPRTIRTRQRKLSRKAKSEFGYWLMTDACL